MEENQYIIISKTAIQRRIEYLEKISPLDRLCYDGMIECEERVLKEILSQSTPLIPEIEKAFDAGEKRGYEIPSLQMRGMSVKTENPTKDDYISNLKLDI